MFRSVRIFFLSVALLCGATGALADRPFHDRHRGENRGRDFGEERGRGERRISLDQAVQMAQQRYNAKVVRARPSQEGDRLVYHLRLMSGDGKRIWNIRIDAASGAEL